jgi:hypothetical protein
MVACEWLNDSMTTSTYKNTAEDFRADVFPSLKRAGQGERWAGGPEEEVKFVIRRTRFIYAVMHNS